MSNKETIVDSRAFKEADLEKLKFVKIKIKENVRLIPESLIESVKGRIFSPEQFYKNQEEHIKHENPSNLLYVLTTPTNKIEGYLWVQMSQLDGTMFVNTFSVNKEYWFKGKAIPKVVEFLGTLKDKYKAPRIFWITTNDKFFTKHGFKRSKNVLMEYNSN